MTNAPPEVLTFGCRLNSVESETMQRLASSAGLCDTVIVNTCAVTAEAERQAGQAIRRLKRESPHVRIIVTGCASQIDAQKYAAMKEVDAVIPNDAKMQAESFTNLVAAKPSPPKGGRGLGEGGLGCLYPQSPPSPQPLSPQEGERGLAMQRAFVQIQTGCNYHCTFCIIPYGRGASRSTPIDAITAQVRACADKGFNEIVLTGVDIASYGQDLPDRPTLGSLIRRVLQAVPTLPRLRLSSLDPAAIDEDLWDLVAQEPRLMPHLHLSLQAGDDMILKRMKRRHSRDDIFRLCARARHLRPDIVFGADIIAGFPTETDAMFANTHDLVEKCSLTWLHVFPYSARKLTPAAKMPQVHGAIRKERADRLRALGERAARRHYESLIGTTVKVLVENNGIGCTPHFAKLKLQGQARVGGIVEARCVRGENDAVVAEVVKVV